MTIQEILAEQSVWTWDTFFGSLKLGEVVREDALTSVNLVTINDAATEEGIPLTITSMQGANLEIEFGADWYWKLDNFAYLVQAKKLEVAKRAELASYTINVPQLKQLQVQADAMTDQFGFDVQPTYVFFNTLPGTEADPADWGCTAAQAEMLIAKLEETGQIDNATATIRFSAISEHMIPWHRLFYVEAPFS